MKISMVVRYPFLFFLKVTGRLALLFERANYTEIGSTSHISVIDRDIAKKRKLKPLNRFEKWLLKPFIKDEKKRRWNAYRQAVIEVLGEDPEKSEDPEEYEELEEFLR